MNERIRLLAEQAFFDDASGQPSDRMYTFSDHKMQKFAELIVRECVLISRTSTDGFNAGRQMEEHFGVES